MKKQILFLILLLINVIVAYAQPTPPAALATDPENLTAAPTYCVPVTQITASCIQAPGPLNPTPGMLYNYSVTITPNTPSMVYWFVTTDPDFIDPATGNITTNIEDATTSDYIMAAGTTYANDANTTPNVDITWQAIPSSVDIFLVTYVRGAAGCPDNIKAYKIEVQHTFTLDIARMTSGGVANTLDNSCVSPVIGAQYIETAGVGSVQMDYGVNYIYFVVNAANFAHSWLPSFQLTATNTTASSTLAVDWAYPDQSYTGATTLDWHTTTPAGNIFTSSDPVLPHLTPGASGVGATGECIIVRVTVDHNLNETLDPIVLSLGVNGIMYDQNSANYLNVALADIAPVDGPNGECPWQVDYDDNLGFTLNPRSEIVDETDPDPADNFIPDNGE